jgi:hypothetical protein
VRPCASRDGSTCDGTWAQAHVGAMTAPTATKDPMLRIA